MTIADPRAHLAVVAAQLRAGKLADDARERLAAELQAIADGEDARDVLGVRRRPGERLWSTLQAISERDRLLCEARARFFRDDSNAAAARHLHEALSNYSTSAWQRERAAAELPPRHIGTLREVCWRALRAVDRVPAERTIRSLLSAS